MYQMFTLQPHSIPLCAAQTGFKEALFNPGFIPLNMKKLEQSLERGGES